MNLSIKINLTRIKGANLVNLKGKTDAVKQCVVLPVEDCGLFVGEKGVYIDIVAIPYKEPKHDQTHFIKQSIDKDIYNYMTEEERGNIPIIGGLKEFTTNKMQATDTVEYADYKEVEEDDLPF